MRQIIEQMIFRQITPLSIKYLSPPEFDTVTGLGADVFRQLEKEFQIVPPITLHHHNPELMSGVWSLCRETLIAGHGRALKEAVAIAISELNRCPYCVDVHTSMLQGSQNEPGDSSQQTGEGQYMGAFSRKATVAWAASTLHPSSPLLSAPPFSASQAPAIMGTAVLFHYINRMVNVFLDRNMMPGIANVPLVRQTAFSLFTSLVSGRITVINVVPGRSLTVLPDSELPGEFKWAERNPFVAGGFLRFASAAEAAADETIHRDVRALVTEQVNGWKGDPPGLGKAWLEEAVSGLPANLKAQASLALLTALASWAVDEPLIRAFREFRGDDRSLLNTAAWGAYLAAKRIAGWLHPPAESAKLNSP